MRRSTLGFLTLLGLLTTGILYGLYWFYRIPMAPNAENSRLPGFQMSDLVSGGTPEGSIPSIDAPVFESAGSADQYLKDDGMGLDVEVDGTHRFYPYQILVWHEAVNDVFGQVPLLITYSPLTMTGIVFERPNPSDVFRVSPSLWNNNLLLVDEPSRSLWSQILSRAVEGERAGTNLVPYPSSVMTWDDWKRRNPRGEVLTRDTGAVRDYTRDPYGNYALTQTILFPLTSVDDRLPAKKLVCVTDENGVRTAYPSDYKQKPDGCTEGFWFVFAAAFPDAIDVFQLP